MGLREDAENAILYGRVEHALTIYTKVLEIEIEKLRSGKIEDKTCVVKTMVRFRHFFSIFDISLFLTHIHKSKPGTGRVFKEENCSETKRCIRSI